MENVGLSKRGESGEYCAKMSVVLSIFKLLNRNSRSSGKTVSSASSGDPQNERKLTPSVLSRGPGTGQRGSSWYSRV